MSNSRPRLGRVALIFGVVILIGYGLFEARRYLTGPVIVIESPAPYEEVAGPSVTIRGHGENLSFLYINGEQAYLDEEGRLAWVYAPPLGYTVLIARAEDRFGRAREVRVPFVIK
jgi:hypothetical protein